jgi:hypothetical protein
MLLCHMLSCQVPISSPDVTQLKQTTSLNHAPMPWAASPQLAIAVGHDHRDQIRRGRMILAVRRICRPATFAGGLGAVLCSVAPAPHAPAGAIMPLRARGSWKRIQQMRDLLRWRQPDE